MLNPVLDMAQPEYSICLTSPYAPGVAELIESHLALMRACSPPESVHALAPDALANPHIALYTIRKDACLLGMAALKYHTHAGLAIAEIKSMHITPNARGRGIGRYLCRFLIAQARKCAVPALYLETGTEPEFTPARNLYSALGFEICPPFADYREDPNSVFMRKPLTDIPEIGRN